jgi:hypothetical protein
MGLSRSVGRPSGALHTADRACLRELRAAELAAWQSADRTEELLARHTLQLDRRWTLPDDRAETFVLKGLYLVSLAAIAYAVVTSLQWLERWPAFVELVGRIF